MQRSVRVLMGAAAIVAGLLVLAAPPSAASESPAAQACQKGGYLSYVTTDGRRFVNVGACVSYVAHGGTLVGLPDLVVEVSCTTGERLADCVFVVRNAGPGPAIGPVTLQASLTLQDETGLALPTATIPLFGAQCDADSSYWQVDYSFDGPAVTAQLTAICFGTIPAGAAVVEHVELAGHAPTTSPIHVQGSAALPPGSTEVTLTNNQFSSTFFG